MNFTINQFYLFCLTNMIEVLNAFKFQFMSLIISYVVLNLNLIILFNTPIFIGIFSNKSYYFAIINYIDIKL